MRFADIPGHETVKAHLRDLVDRRHMPHALLLEGTEGIAKFALLRATAQYIHCQNRTPDGDSCGRCPSCLQHEHFNHIDTFFSFPLLKKKSKPTISDDYAAEFADFCRRDPFMDFGAWLAEMGNDNGQPAIFVEEAAHLLERLNLKARQAEFKIVLMWRPDRLRAEAANKLLKLIEEPHADTIFLLSSDNPRGILPTIYSRTQRINVQPYTEAEISAMLQRNLAADPAAATTAAALADGSYVRAVRLLSVDGERRQFMALFISLMRLAWQRKVRDLKDWAAELAKLGREPLMRFYAYCARMTRENYIRNIGDDRLLSMAPDERAFSDRFAPFINERNVEDIAAILDKAAADTALNGNARIIAFDLAVKMILLIKR